MAQTELRYISRLLTVFAAIVVPGALAMVLGLGLRLGPSLTTILAVVFIFIAFIALAWFYLLIQRRKAMRAWIRRVTSVLRALPRW